MGGMSGAYLNGEFKSMRNLAELGKLWAVNGKIPGNVHTEPPLLTLELGKSYILELINSTAFEHPIHLHGHSFRVIRKQWANNLITRRFEILFYFNRVKTRKSRLSLIIRDNGCFIVTFSNTRIPE